MLNLVRALLPDFCKPKETEKMGAPLKVVMSETSVEEEYARFFETSLPGLPGGDEVSILRKQAMARFSELGLPNRRVEEWKYTDLKGKISSGAAPVSGDIGSLKEDDLKKATTDLGLADSLKLVFLNGRFSDVLSDTQMPSGVSVLPLADALTQSPEWFSETFNNANLPEKEESVIALNTALMVGGVALRIEGKIDRPISLVNWNLGEESDLLALRNVISVAPEASATIVERYVFASGGAAQTNSVTEMIVGDGAEVHHIKQQSESAEAIHLSTWMTRLGRDTVYRVFQSTIGASLSRSQLFVRFDGVNASLDISGAAMLSGRQHGDTTIFVDHAVPQCESRELFKAVLDDEARGVFQAKVVVRPHAQKTDGAQMSQALLLSETAEFDSKPELEIYADDVVCGHGATSGQIDEELLFYLRARGLPESEARAMLIKAFISEAFEKIEHDDVRTSLMEDAERWLSRHTG